MVESRTHLWMVLPQSCPYSASCEDGAPRGLVQGAEGHQMLKAVFLGRVMLT